MFTVTKCCPSVLEECKALHHLFSQNLKVAFCKCILKKKKKNPTIGTRTLYVCSIEIEQKFGSKV